MEREKNDGVEWILTEAARDESNEARYPDYKERFPYEVVLVDQYQGHCEEGYDKVARYATPEEALRVAMRITEASIKRYGSVAAWLGMGDAGLIYDAKGKLIWDGVEEYTSKKRGDAVFKALDFAASAHVGQYRKGTTIPYFIHPLRVAEILIEHGCTDKIVIAGVLHDTIEDTPAMYGQIREEFGHYVAELVNGVTEQDRSLAWKERKQRKLECLAKASEDVLLVACADKIDNLRQIRRDYAKMGEEIWKRFNSPKDEQNWYYKSLVDLFVSRLKWGESVKLAKTLGEEYRLVFGQGNEAQEGKSHPKRSKRLEEILKECPSFKVVEEDEGLGIVT